MARCRLWIWPFLIAAAFLIRPAYDLCFLLVALATANLMAVLLTRPGGFSLGWPGRHLRVAGKLSYSIYLIHQPLLWLVPVSVERLLVGHEIHPLAAYASCMASWGLVMLLSWGFYRLVELPSIDLGKWFVQRSTAR
jgi:peptidoglycan/LPS O-acetylase OafA/YrhL